MLERIKEGSRKGVSPCVTSLGFGTEWTNGFSPSVELLCWRGGAAPWRARWAVVGLRCNSCPKARVSYTAACQGCGEPPVPTVPTEEHGQGWQPWATSLSSAACRLHGTSLGSPWCKVLIWRESLFYLWGWWRAWDFHQYWHFGGLWGSPWWWLPLVKHFCPLASKMKEPSGVSSARQEDTAAHPSTAWKSQATNNWCNTAQLHCGQPCNGQFISAEDPGFRVIKDMVEKNLLWMKEALTKKSQQVSSLFFISEVCTQWKHGQGKFAQHLT